MIVRPMNAETDPLPAARAFLEDLHFAKGGAVETGCSDLNGVIYHFTI